MKRILTVLIFICSFTFSSCEYWYTTALMNATFKSDLLIVLEREDGQPIASLVDYIESVYGFRAQKMNIVVPSFTMDILESYQTRSPDPSDIRATVTGWEAVVKDVINDAIVNSMSFTINGTESFRCEKPDDDCGNRYAVKTFLEETVPVAIQNALTEKMQLRFIGPNEELKKLQPSLVNFYCSVDQRLITDEEEYSDTVFDISEAVSCAGEVYFTLAP